MCWRYKTIVREVMTPLGDTVRYFRLISFEILKKPKSVAIL
jgi:hypothetical protein